MKPRDRYWANASLMLPSASGEGVGDGMRTSPEDRGAGLAGEVSLASAAHGLRSRAPSTSEGVAAGRDDLVEAGELGSGERARHGGAAMRDAAPAEACALASCRDGGQPTSFAGQRGQRHRRLGRGLLGHGLPALAIIASILVVLLGSPPGAAAQHYCAPQSGTCGTCTSMAPWNESAPEAAQAHPCLGCEWMHVTGGGRGALMGLYRRVNRGGEGKYMWYKGDADAYLSWFALNPTP